MNSYIVKSFIKGIFKTSGTLLVLGVGVFIYSTINKLKDTQHKKMETENLSSDIDTEYINKDNIKNDNCDDKKFKKLFTF